MNPNLIPSPTITFSVANQSNIKWRAKEGEGGKIELTGVFNGHVVTVRFQKDSQDQKTIEDFISQIGEESLAKLVGHTAQISLTTKQVSVYKGTGEINESNLLSREDEAYKALAETINKINSIFQNIFFKKKENENDNEIEFKVEKNEDFENKEDLLQSHGHENVEKKNTDIVENENK